MTMKQIEINVPEAVVPYVNVECGSMLIVSDTTPIITSLMRECLQREMLRNVLRD